MEKAFCSDSKKNNIVARKNDIIARIKSHGKQFEIVVVAEKALEYRETGKGNLMEIVLSEGIFSDIKKGIKFSTKDLEDAFGTSDIYQIADKIIKKGELQLPSSFKEKARELKFNQIIDWLVSSCSDPAGRPHPAERIKIAISQVGVKIDENKPVEEQAMAIFKLIQKILPIKIATKRVALKVPAIYAAKLYGNLKGYIIHEDWLSDGSLSCVVEVPARTQIEFFDKINSLTHGSIITKEM